MKRPQIVVIGSGFGGMQAAQSLAALDANILLIDRRNFNTFVPLLYQTAFAQIEPGFITIPIRTIVRKYTNVRFLLDSVEKIDLDRQLLYTSQELIRYDYLVVATGSQMRQVSIPGVAESAWMMRTVEDAIALRNHILTCFETAAHEPDAVKRQQWLTFAIAGGGTTGVEVAGALVELVETLIQRDYRMLRPEDVRIVLLQRGDRLLPDLPPNLGAYALKTLRRLGVDVHLGATVSQVEVDAVYLSNRQSIATNTVIWTVGLEGAVPSFLSGVTPTERNQLVVLPTLQLVDYPTVYAIGDVAAVQGARLTGVAPEALQQGVAVAQNIERQIQGRSPQPFRYFNKGRLAIIGGYTGVGQIAGVPLTGFVPWLLWLLVHWVYLPGWRNRVLVLLGWLQAFVGGDRAARAMISSPPQSSPMRQISPQQPERR